MCGVVLFSGGVRRDNTESGRERVEGRESLSTCGWWGIFSSIQSIVMRLPSEEAIALEGGNSMGLILDARRPFFFFFFYF